MARQKRLTAMATPLNWNTCFPMVRSDERLRRAGDRYLPGEAGLHRYGNAHIREWIRNRSGVCLVQWGKNHPHSDHQNPHTVPSSGSLGGRGLLKGLRCRHPIVRGRRTPITDGLTTEGDTRERFKMKKG